MQKSVLLCAALCKLARQEPGDPKENFNIVLKCMSMNPTGSPSRYQVDDVKAHMWHSDAHLYIVFDSHVDNRSTLIRSEDYTLTGKVHLGYLQKYLQIESAICTDMLKYDIKGCLQITLCGFGAGGAVATIAALHLALKFPYKKISCCTFSAPKVGDKCFKDAYKKHVHHSIRIIGNYDQNTPSYGPYVHVHKGVKLHSTAINIKMPMFEKLMMFIKNKRYTSLYTNDQERDTIVDILDNMS